MELGELERRLEAIVREETEADALALWEQTAPPARFNYRFDHTRTVVHTARYLMNREGGDPVVVMAAAWLHDIDKKFVSEAGEEPLNGPLPHHGIRGARRAREILIGLGLPEHVANAVHDAIATHVGLFEDDQKRSLEGDILWDADKLTKIGAVSIGHAFWIAPAFEPVTTERMIERGRRWVELMTRTAAAFKTETARRIGRERLTFLQTFYRRMESEYRMEESHVTGS